MHLISWFDEDLIFRQKQRVIIGDFGMFGDFGNFHTYRKGMFGGVNLVAIISTTKFCVAFNISVLLIIF